MKVSDEVWEIAQDLYDDADFDINRYGELESFAVMDFEDYNGYYRDCKKSDYEKAKQYLDELLTDVKYYDGKLVLSDNDTLNNIPYDDIPEEGKNYNEDNFWEIQSFVYDKALQGLQEEIGTEVYGLGRSGKHICVDDTFRNLTKLDEYKTAHEKWEQWFTDEMVKELSYTDGEITESLNSDEKVAKCLSCGMKIKYKNRDVQHDVAGDYLECPNCHSTFDVDYDNIEPLLHKKTETLNVNYSYDIPFKITVSNNGDVLKELTFDNQDKFDKAKKIISSKNNQEIYDWTQGVCDFIGLDTLTESEDMSKVKDDIKDAVEKSDSTDLEKDQVKGSIDVLKTDEESAIEGYEDFKAETEKVADKELADAVNDQMEEIVDDEKEHIEKLDTIKSALGEGLELDDEETKFINAMVTRSKSDIEDFLGYDLTSKQFKDKQGLRLAIKEIYEQMPDEEFNKFKSALGESKEAPRLTGDETYVAKNSSGYKSIGLIVNNKTKQFQIINGQVMTTDSKTKKMSKKQIRAKAQQLYDNGYTEYDGYGSVAQGVEKKTEADEGKQDWYYYEIHFDFTEESEKDSDGYSKFFKSKENVEGDYPEEVWNLAIAENVIGDEEDFEDIDYTQQIDKDEYDEATGTKAENKKIEAKVNKSLNIDRLETDPQGELTDYLWALYDSVDDSTEEGYNTFKTGLDKVVNTVKDVLGNTLYVHEEVEDDFTYYSYKGADKISIDIEYYEQIGPFMFYIPKELNEGKKAESKTMKKENAPLNESDSLGSDPKFYEYVKSLLDAGSIDDPKYYNSLSDKEKEDLIRNTWMKDADIINYYKNEIQLKTETDNKFKTNVALHNLGINNASKLMQDLDTALENNDETKIKSIVKKLKNSLSSNDYKSFIKTYYPEYKDVLEKIEDKSVKTETVKVMAYGKLYYEYSDDEWNSKSEDEKDATIIDVADQATEEEGHTVETDEVEVITEAKNLSEDITSKDVDEIFSKYAETPVTVKNLKQKWASASDEMHGVIAGGWSAIITGNNFKIKVVNSLKLSGYKISGENIEEAEKAARKIYINATDIGYNTGLYESKEVKTEKIESKKVEVEVKNMNDIIDRLYSGDKVYFKDTTGYFADINQYYVCEKSLDYPKDPNDYDEGYTSGWNIGDDTAYDKEQERKYQRAKKASEDGDVWEFDEVDENGEYVGVVATICYGKDELQYVLDDANLTPVNQVKKFTEKMGKDADKKYSNLYKYKGKAFAYDNENAIVEYVYVDPEDNSWIVLDEIGLSNDNWDNKEARDEYLDEYIAQLDDEANRLADDFIANEYLGESLSSRYIKTEANGGTDTLDANSDLLPIINMYQYEVYNYCDDLVPPPDADMSKDVDEVMLDIAKPMIEEEIKGVLPSAKITFKEYKHPKYYKLFSNLNDVLYFDITYNVAEYEALKEKAVKDPEFEQYLKDHYKSYDGFMSFFADNLTAFNQQEEWKQFVSVLSYYLPNDDEENYNNMLSDTYEGLLNMGYEHIDSVIEGLADDITDKANAGDMTINTDTVTQYVKELYGNEDSYDYILDGVLKTLSITESKKTEAKGESERGYITGEVEAIIDGMTDLDKSKITGKLIDDVVDIVSDGDVSVDSPEFDERVTSVVLNMLDESKTMKTESASADVIEYFGMQDNTDEEYKNNVAKEYKTLRAKYPDKEMILNGDFGTYLGTEKATPVEKGKYITVYESKKVAEDKKFRTGNDFIGSFKDLPDNKKPMTLDQWVGSEDYEATLCDYFKVDMFSEIDKESISDKLVSELYNDVYLANYELDESKKVTEAEVATATKSAGEYWVGDPCYVLPDEVYFGIWDKQYKFNDGTIDCGNGLSFQVHGTAWGDGEYKGSNGFVYGVDAGVLAIVPMELATKEIGLTLGTRHKSSTAKLEYKDGVFNMIFDTETITIDTDPSDNDLNESKQLKKEEYEVRQDYYDPETGEATRNEYVMSFDTWEEAQRFADGLAKDPNCTAWVNDTSKDESKKIEDKELLAEDTDEIPVVNPDEQDYYDNKGYIISLYPRSRSNVSII